MISSFPTVVFVAVADAPHRHAVPPTIVLALPASMSTKSMRGGGSMYPPAMIHHNGGIDGIVAIDVGGYADPPLHRRPPSRRRHPRHAGAPRIADPSPSDATASTPHGHHGIVFRCRSPSPIAMGEGLGGEGPRCCADCRQPLGQVVVPRVAATSYCEDYGANVRVPRGRICEA